MIALDSRCQRVLFGVSQVADAPAELEVLGLPENAFDDVTSRALDGVGDRDPRGPGARSLRRLLEDAHAGRPPGTY